MEEFPSNANVDKERKVKKVITGSAEIKKKSELSKIADVFLAEDIRSVKSYLIRDVIVPAIRDGIVDIVTNGINTLMYGSSGSPSSKKSISAKISYNTPYYKMSSMSSSNSQKENYETRPKKVYEYDDILLKNRGDAEVLLKSMDDVIKEFGSVSIADYYDLADKSSEYTTNKYGWTDLREAYVDRYRGYYFVKLPKPSPLG